VYLGKETITEYKTAQDIKKGLNDYNVVINMFRLDIFWCNSKQLNISSCQFKSRRSQSWIWYYISLIIDIEYLEESANKAYGKYLRFKQKPSLFGIKQAKETHIVEIHPLFKKEENEDTREVNNFLQELKNFKPKSTIFDYTEEEKKQELLRQYHDKAEYFRKKKEREKEIDVEIENTKRTEKEEPQQIDEDEDKKEDLLKNKRKRSKIRNFKENPHYISDKADGSKNLWGNEKPLDLEELTVNILPDDASNNKQKFVWDPKKKNFTFAKLDEGGKIIRKNESGVKIKEKDKFQAYKKWQKKTKLKIQKVGEEENTKIVNNAYDNLKEKRYLKRTKQSRFI
jgi:hypothetical protein